MLWLVKGRVIHSSARSESPRPEGGGGGGGRGGGGWVTVESLLGFRCRCARSRRPCKPSAGPGRARMSTSPSRSMRSSWVGPSCSRVPSRARMCLPAHWIAAFWEGRSLSHFSGVRADHPLFRRVSPTRRSHFNDGDPSISEDTVERRQFVLNQVSVFCFRHIQELPEYGMCFSSLLGRGVV